jgi:acetyl-CoA synthetase
MARKQPARKKASPAPVASASPATIDVLLSEKRTFAPPKAFAAKANAKSSALYAKGAKNPEAYWAEWAKQLTWDKPWKKVLEWKPPHAKWFLGGKLNASVNCLDRHIDGFRRTKAAIVWEGEPGDRRTLTYRELYIEVNKFANVLRKFGIRRGDRVTIYLGMVPELPIAMLACARIGAIHSVVFGGFSAEALRDRINDQGAKLLITADGGWRRGNVVPLKKIADEALEDTPTIENVVLVMRTHTAIDVKEGRDHWWHRLMADAPVWCKPESMDAEDVLYILYTSGTTGKPKGIVHTTGGYMTGTLATSKLVFDLKEDDIFWCTADIGWVTGHSYVVYGPLANGATCVMYEGAPDTPGRDRFWDIIERHGVTILYTAPTAIRTFMKWGTEFPDKHDLSSLRLLGTVGEPINPEAWIWYQKTIGKGRCPIVDTWWQTETGCILITPLPGLTKTKPGSATVAFPGIEPKILDELGNEIKVGGGYLALTKPWPSMLRTLWGDDERYQKTYFGKWDKSIYFTGDGARRDKDGYFWLMGRVDDVMNVAGHRIGTMEVESALVDHPAVAEAAVVGITDEMKGTGIAAFVILKEKGRTQEAADTKSALQQEIKAHVVKKIGPIARPDKLFFTVDLPKTRSGKIMRRLLRDVAEGRVLGDTTTLADPTVVKSLKEQYEEKEG